MNHNNINIPTTVFIDGSWLYFATRRIGKQINYAEFFDTLINQFGPKTKIYFFGAINPIDRKQTKFYSLLKKIGYVVHLVELVKIHNIFTPKGLDVELVVNAMKILPFLKKFVLVSGDGDFAALLKQIINSGVSVSLISLPFSAGYILRKTVGEAFLNLETLLCEHKYIKKSPTFKKIAKTKVLIPDSLYIEKGNYLEPYLRIRNLMKSAKDNITIIDQYVDDQILTMIKLLKTKINITIFTNKTSPIDFCVQIKKLRNEGRLVTIYKNNAWHDRFIGIDNVWWHSGHSFKDLGGKDSMLNKVTGKIPLDKLKARVEKEKQNSEEICKQTNIPTDFSVGRDTDTLSDTGDRSQSHVDKLATSQVPP